MCQIGGDSIFAVGNPYKMVLVCSVIKVNEMAIDVGCS